VGGPEEVGRLAGSLNRMAEEIRGRMEAERRARSELESVLAGMVEGVVAVDSRESVLFMNAAAARLLGLQKPLAAGEALWEAFRFPDLEEDLRAALAGHAPDRRDTHSPSAYGHTLEIAAGPLGGGSGAVAILRDVTEVRRMERIRMDFVANVSHELRTPLAGVVGSLETLEGEDLGDGERRKFLDIARRNAERLQALVADLLDLSAIESEGTSLPREPVDVASTVRSAAALLAGAAAERRVSLTVDPAPGDFRVPAHARRLEQAFVNLVENAIKYTPAGGKIDVRIRDRGGEIAIEVEDSGIGIPPEALPRIFERFFRADPSRSRQMGGTGLGLAIVKHIVRAHRGRVDVRSTEGVGSVFTVVLPRA
jgi:two-component system phosphate regulon sensor histidine kinase PhoR